MATVKYDSNSNGNNQSIPMSGFDHIEIYVGNARQAAHFYRTVFGFTPVAYRGLETGDRDRTSIALRQKEINIVLTEALAADSEVAEHVKQHGEDVKDIAFTVDDAAGAYESAVSRGARPVMSPTVLEDEHGSVTKATIGAFGDTVHTFVERKDYRGAFLPTFQPVTNPPPVRPTGLYAIDHVAVSIEAHKMNELVDYYIQVLGFHHSYSEDILTEYSGMNSKVVQDSTGAIKFPIVEPTKGKRKSQVEEYLAYHQGAGAQHVALTSDDIVRTVRALRENGTEFLPTLGTYYGMLNERVGTIEEEVEQLRDLNILVDRDEWGYLMQIFTKPLLNRPTVFMEVIQRKGARGFGGGNIKALFEAVEREQSLRGNL
jgi:4-hydroxyphenylpyruvate dioxygenase